MPATYAVTNIATATTVRGYSLAQAAELVGVDADELAWAIEEEGEGTTDAHRVVEEEGEPDASAPDVMQAPVAYAAVLVAWEGSRPAALVAFDAAVTSDPTFALAPASWVAAVRAELNRE